MIDTASRPFVRRWSDVWNGAGALVVVVICMFAVRNGTVSDVEESVFGAINGLPDLLDPPMFAVQLLGMLLVPVVVAALAWWRKKPQLAVALVAIVPLKLIVEKSIVKALVERERPGTTVPDAILRGDVPAEGLSFPSGHVIIAFAIVVLLAAYVSRRWLLVLVAVGLLVATSRMYLGAHLPLDVLAGAAAGVVIGSALNLATGVPATEPG